MKVHPEKCIDRSCHLAEKDVSRLKQLDTPCMDDHQMVPEEFETKGELSPVCAQIALKCLYFARTGRPDILWTVNILAKSVTEWNKARGKRLA